jgi:nucleoside-diphosphate-sugar epimerase
MQGDLSDVPSIERAMEGVTEVLHITNIRFTLQVVEAALRQGVERVIAVHTTGVYSRFREASGEYREIEAELEELVVRHPQLKLCILRPTMIFGDLCDRNISKFIRMMDCWRLFPLVDGGRGNLQPVNARDLARAYLQVIRLAPEKRRRDYVLSGQQVVTMRELLEMILTCLGKRTAFLSCPAAVGVVLARAVRMVSLGRVDLVEKVQRMIEDRSFSHEAATADFGYDPEPLQQGIEREVEAYLRSRGRSLMRSS